MPADLLIGGTLGGWALERARPQDIAQVVTGDPDLAAAAAARGHAVRGDHDYTPSARGLSVHYQRIVPATLIDAYEGLWNLHPGLLPWGRGMYPVFWALWEGTPAGATLHELTVGLDEGPVVEQKRVAVLPLDTGGRLHERVQVAERELFMRWLARLATGKRPPATPQRPGGSYHTLAEFEHLRDEGRYEVPRADRERLARCLTFPDNPPLPVRNTP
jgi:folate-dependent phosphoribosylglycinamide formyltransferase PurN